MDEIRLEIARDAINVYSVMRDCFYPDSHAEALKLTLEMLGRAEELSDEPEQSDDEFYGKITLLEEVWRKSPKTKEKLDRKKRFEI